MNINLIRREKKLGYLPADNFPSLKLKVFVSEARGKLRVSRNQMRTVELIILQIFFHNAWDLKIGKYHSHVPQSEVYSVS